VTKAVSVMAGRSGAWIVVGFCVPDARGYYSAGCMEPFNPRDEGMTESEITQRVTSLLEEIIRRHPDHWLWSYKRWKYRAPGSDLSRYPFYASQERVYLKLNAEEQGEKQ
jgi:lauroyl/myristoyl acyltransferase